MKHPHTEKYGSHEDWKEVNAAPEIKSMQGPKTITTPTHPTPTDEQVAKNQLLAIVLKYIDFDAQNLKRWFDECDLEGHHGDNTQQAYQLAYNSLVTLRAKMRIELLSKPLPDGFDKIPEATEMIYIDLKKTRL